MPKDNTIFKHPREVVFLGAAIMSFEVISWVIELLTNSEFPPLKLNDILFAGFGLGTVALVSGAVLWITMKLGNYRLGVLLVKIFFSLISIGWISSCIYLLNSDLHIVTSLFLSVALAVLLFGYWMFSWYPTITIKSANKSQ